MSVRKFVPGERPSELQLHETHRENGTDAEEDKSPGRSQTWEELLDAMQDDLTELARGSPADMPPRPRSVAALAPPPPSAASPQPHNREHLRAIPHALRPELSPRELDLRQRERDRDTLRQLLDEKSRAREEQLRRQRAKATAAQMNDNIRKQNQRHLERRHAGDLRTMALTVAAPASHWRQEHGSDAYRSLSPARSRRAIKSAAESAPTSRTSRSRKRKLTTASRPIMKLQPLLPRKKADQRMARQSEGAGKAEDDGVFTATPPADRQSREASVEIAEYAEDFESDQVQSRSPPPSRRETTRGGAQAVQASGEDSARPIEHDRQVDGRTKSPQRRAQIRKWMRQKKKKELERRRAEEQTARAKEERRRKTIADIESKRRARRQQAKKRTDPSGKAGSLLQRPPWRDIIEPDASPMRRHRTASPKQRRRPSPPSFHTLSPAQHASNLRDGAVTHHLYHEGNGHVPLEPATDPKIRAGRLFAARAQRDVNSDASAEDTRDEPFTSEKPNADGDGDRPGVALQSATEAGHALLFDQAVRAPKWEAYLANPFKEAETQDANLIADDRESDKRHEDSDSLEIEILPKDCGIDVATAEAKEEQTQDRRCTSPQPLDEAKTVDASLGEAKQSLSGEESGTIDRAREQEVKADGEDARRDARRSSLDRHVVDLGKAIEGGHGDNLEKRPMEEEAGTSAVVGKAITFRKMAAGVGGDPGTGDNRSSAGESGSEVVKASSELRENHPEEDVKPDKGLDSVAIGTGDEGAEQPPPEAVVEALMDDLRASLASRSGRAGGLSESSAGAQADDRASYAEREACSPQAEAPDSSQMDDDVPKLGTTIASSADNGSKTQGFSPDSDSVDLSREGMVEDWDDWDPDEVVNRVESKILLKFNELLGAPLGRDERLSKSLPTARERRPRRKLLPRHSRGISKLKRGRDDEHSVATLVAKTMLNQKRQAKIARLTASEAFSDDMDDVPREMSTASAEGQVVDALEAVVGPSRHQSSLDKHGKNANSESRHDKPLRTDEAAERADTRADAHLEVPKDGAESEASLPRTDSDDEVYQRRQFWDSLLREKFQDLSQPTSNVVSGAQTLQNQLLAEMDFQEALFQHQLQLEKLVQTQRTQAIQASYAAEIRKAEELVAQAQDMGTLQENIFNKAIHDERESLHKKYESAIAEQAQAYEEHAGVLDLHLAAAADRETSALRDQVAFQRKLLRKGKHPRRSPQRSIRARPAATEHVTTPPGYAKGTLEDAQGDFSTASSSLEISYERDFESASVTDAHAQRESPSHISSGYSERYSVDFESTSEPSDLPIGKKKPETRPAEHSASYENGAGSVVDKKESAPDLRLQEVEEFRRQLKASQREQEKLLDDRMEQMKQQKTEMEAKLSKRIRALQELSVGEHDPNDGVRQRGLCYYQGLLSRVAADYEEGMGRLRVEKLNLKVECYKQLRDFVRALEGSKLGGDSAIGYQNGDVAANALRHDVDAYLASEGTGKVLIARPYHSADEAGCTSSRAKSPRLKDAATDPCEDGDLGGPEDAPSSDAGADDRSFITHKQESWNQPLQAPERSAGLELPGSARPMMVEDKGTQATLDVIDDLATRARVSEIAIEESSEDVNVLEAEILEKGRQNESLNEQIDKRRDEMKQLEKRLHLVAQKRKLSRRERELEVERNTLDEAIHSLSENLVILEGTGRANGDSASVTSRASAEQSMTGARYAAPHETLPDEDSSKLSTTGTGDTRDEHGSLAKIEADVVERQVLEWIGGAEGETAAPVESDTVEDSFGSFSDSFGGRETDDDVILLRVQQRERKKAREAAALRIQCLFRAWVAKSVMEARKHFLNRSTGGDSDGTLQIRESVDSFESSSLRESIPREAIEANLALVDDFEREVGRVWKEPPSTQTTPRSIGSVGTPISQVEPQQSQEVGEEHITVSAFSEEQASTKSGDGQRVDGQRVDGQRVDERIADRQSADGQDAITDGSAEAGARNAAALVIQRGLRIMLKRRREGYRSVDPGEQPENRPASDLLHGFDHVEVASISSARGPGALQQEVDRLRRRSAARKIQHSLQSWLLQKASEQAAPELAAKEGDMLTGYAYVEEAMPAADAQQREASDAAAKSDNQADLLEDYGYVEMASAAAPAKGTSSSKTSTSRTKEAGEKEKTVEDLAEKLFEKLVEEAVQDGISIQRDLGTAASREAVPEVAVDQNFRPDHLSVAPQKGSPPVDEGSPSRYQARANISALSVTQASQAVADVPVTKDGAVEAFGAEDRDAASSQLSRQAAESASVPQSGDSVLDPEAGVNDDPYAFDEFETEAVPELPIAFDWGPSVSEFANRLLSVADLSPIVERVKALAAPDAFNLQRKADFSEVVIPLETFLSLEAHYADAAEDEESNAVHRRAVFDTINDFIGDLCKEQYFAHSLQRAPRVRNMRRRVVLTSLDEESLKTFLLESVQQNLCAYGTKFLLEGQDMAGFQMEDDEDWFLPEEMSRQYKFRLADEIFEALVAEAVQDIRSNSTRGRTDLTEA